VTISGQLKRRPHSRSFDRDPSSVAAARRFTRAALSREPEDAVEAVELMVSELATNSIRHAHSGFCLMIAPFEREVRVEVSDASTSPPRMRYPKPGELSGRGLRIVDMLADAWGVERRRSRGKTVWFVLAC
jgi:anti-sigma regulatory factor (Ser/Thr protein kinase)